MNEYFIYFHKVFTKHTFNITVKQLLSFRCSKFAMTEKYNKSWFIRKSCNTLQMETRKI